jgi:hypothetical protein
MLSARPQIATNRINKFKLELLSLCRDFLKDTRLSFFFHFEGRAHAGKLQKDLTKAATNQAILEAVIPVLQAPTQTFGTRVVNQLLAIIKFDDTAALAEAAERTIVNANFLFDLTEDLFLLDQRDLLQTMLPKITQPEEQAIIRQNVDKVFLAEEQANSLITVIKNYNYVCNIGNEMVTDFKKIGAQNNK